MSKKKILSDGKHSWFVDLKSENGNAGTGPAPVTPDATLTANLNDVFDIITGILRIDQLFHLLVSLFSFICSYFNFQVK